MSLLKKSFTFFVLFSIFITYSHSMEKKDFNYILVHGMTGGGWDWKLVDKLLSKDGRLLSQVRADDKARYSFDDNFDCDKSYILEVSNGIGYGVVRNEITTSNISNKLVEDFDLDWAQDCIPSDLECILKLNPIYFDLDESYITSDARVELNKVYVAMIKNPEMRIQIE